ncbi:XRE family transcriptional regulator [Azospirillum argentinense]|uniref:XRE family transcriptional regulator n=2 Tax=Azospirillum TaxID=191 RepID=A0A4D8PZ54_AZOBR|nr:XRE family transcriptional regulator [Azospirillum argentinense]
MEDMPDILALNIRRLRLAKGITQEELAHRAGMDRSYLGGIERAEHKATVVTVGRLAMALSVLPRDLLELPPNHPYLARLAGYP